MLQPYLIGIIVFDEYVLSMFKSNLKKEAVSSTKMLVPTYILEHQLILILFDNSSFLDTGEDESYSD
jgi:hypothetical protein